MNSVAEPLVFLGGLLLGGFGGTVLFRLPSTLGEGAGEYSELRQKAILDGPGVCDSCNTKLSLLECTPLLGLVMNRGRCRTCAGKISPIYLIVELATALIAVSIYIVAGVTPLAFAMGYLCISLLMNRSPST